MRSWLLTGLLLGLVLANLAPIPPRSARSYRFLSEMDPSPAVRSFKSTSLLPGSVVEQPPPDGTVPRGFDPPPYTSSTEDAERAGQELVSPLPAGPETLAIGRKLFRTFCIPCHGAEGLGDGTVVSRGFPAPPSLAAEHARGLPDGRIFHILTYGQANMPSYRNQLTPQERWAVIQFVRQLQTREKAN